MGPLLGNELAVPTKDGVGSDERSKLGERVSSYGLPADGKTATLLIGQPESPATELLPEDSVLLPQILDDSVLLTAHPSGEGGHEDLPGLEDGGHPSIVARKRSIRKPSLTRLRLRPTRACVTIHVGHRGRIGYPESATKTAILAAPSAVELWLPITRDTALQATAVTRNYTPIQPLLHTREVRERGFLRQCSLSAQT